MRRVFAVLAAVLMVALALLVRAALDGDGGSDAASGEGGVPRLLCAEELRDVCTALAAEGSIEVVDVEPAGVTLDRLSDPEAELGADGWLTLDPFPEMVDIVRSTPMFGDPVATDRSTGLGIVAHGDRADALEADCADVDWACLADAAGDHWTDHGGEADWGDVRPGYDAPDTSATGLLVLAQAVAQEVGRNDFFLNDLTPQVVDFIGALEDAVPNRPPSGTVLDTLVVTPPSFAAVGALGNAADAAKLTDRGADLSIFYPAPMFRAEVVLAPVAGHELDLPDGLNDALAADGWVQGQDREPLPSGGSLVALRDAWLDVS